MDFLINLVCLSFALGPLYAIFLCVCCYNRRQDEQPLSFAVDNRRQVHPLLAVRYLTHRYSIRRDLPNDTGLDATVMASLPIFVFKQEKGKSQNDGDEDSSVIQCCVCLSNLEDEETARMLPNCKHVFHVACIDRWLASHSTCPLCRTMVQPRIIEPLPREGPTVQPTVEDTYDADAGGVESRGSFTSLSSFIRQHRGIQRSSSSCDRNIDRDLERQ